MHVNGNCHLADPPVHGWCVILFHGFLCSSSNSDVCGTIPCTNDVLVFTLLYCGDRRWWQVCTCIGDTLSIILYVYATNGHTPTLWFTGYHIVHHACFVQLIGLLWSVVGVNAKTWFSPVYGMGGGVIPTIPWSTWIECYCSDSLQHMDAMWYYSTVPWVVPEILSSYTWKCPIIPAFITYDAVSMVQFCTQCLASLITSLQVRSLLLPDLSITELITQLF